MSRDRCARAIAKPAGPTVSWPTTPCASADGFVVLARGEPPTRMLVMTKSAPSTHARDRVVQRHGARPARARREAGDDLEPRPIGVEERDLGERQAAADQAVDEQRHADAGAADDGELHAASSRRLAHAGSAVAPRQRIDAAGHPRGLRADVIAEAKRRVQRTVAERRGEKAGVERVAGAGRVEHRDARQPAAARTAPSAMTIAPRAPSLMTVRRASVAPAADGRAQRSRHGA